MLCAFPSVAQAQNGKRDGSIGGEVVDAVTQPLSDLNLRKKRIPAILLQAQNEPYDLAQIGSCETLRGEIDRLEAVLGPDANEPDANKNLLEKGLKVGGDMLGGFIPFRGLVRQLSGSAEQQARWQSAIYAGVARRSYLKGYAKASGCASRREVIVDSARSVLGMEPKTGDQPGAIAEPDPSAPISPGNSSPKP